VSTLLQLRGVRKRFAARQLFDLDAVTLDVGQAYALTGDNGAGKSTLLRIIAGLEPAEVDAYRFRDRDVDPRRPPDWLRREVVYMHQLPYLFQTSIADNIAYGLKMRGVSRAARAARVREAMEWAGVQHLAATPPAKLSGGERQRVALARTWVLKPSVYLLDEPTASLDADGRRQVAELIGRLCAGDNCVMVACHDRELITLPHMQRLHLTAGRLARSAAQSDSRGTLVNAG
jgi:tungstate transport system ATP-binding protein